MTPEAKKSNESEAPISGKGLTFCQIKEIMSLMKKEGITHFRMGEGEGRLSISRAPATVIGTAQGCAQPVFPDPCRDETPFDVGSNPSESVRTGHVVTSPVVGVFYDTPAPDQAPYVEVGSIVKKGDVLCIIEAMKLMNEVTSPVSGTVTEILVQKASRVEFGQELFIIEPSENKEYTHE
ncbi:MAG: acetyl-CoA carboxylase biotin carboxyl carrier protein [Clostridiales bacterium]|nr:acetyl-CoA carboxylase biotin carboxyl carrier protein [Clostridiales bacterium]